MTPPPWSSSAPMSETMRRALKELRHGLLRLHKALLDAERVTYERIYGRVASPGQLLQLVMSDPWFVWLHPLSHLVVRIDEMLENETETTVEEVQKVLAEVRSLIRPSEHGDGFERNYYENLQRAPDVVLAHAHVKKLLSMVPA